ncbi:MAG: universal stress protein [Burkholderiales bacterium]
MYNHILLPTDGSALAREAAQAGVKLAQVLGARVTGFYAAPPATPVEFKGILPVGFIDPVEHAVAIEKAAAKHLDVIPKAAARAQVPCQVKHVTSDYPADAIIVAAKKYKCDLIFMASHGRRGVRRDSMLGTQTQRVLAESKIPVLVHR